MSTTPGDTRSGMKSSARPPRSCRATSGRGILSAAWGATNSWSLCGISGTRVRWSGTWSGYGSSSTVSRSPNSPRSILPAAWELRFVPRMDRPLRFSTSAPTTPSISPSVGAGTVGASIGMSARPEDGYPCCKIGRRGIFFIKVEVDRRVRRSTSTFFILTV